MATDRRNVRQLEFDWPRARQLAVVRNCVLPKKKRDKSGHGASGASLKQTLWAIDECGRGRPGGCFASIKTLARIANLGVRTVTRCIEVLIGLGLLIVTSDGPRCGTIGSPVNRYTIVWNELALLCPPEALRPGGKALRPGGKAERPGGKAERPGGAQNDYEAPIKRRLNDTSDGTGRDGAKGDFFWTEELEAIRRKANRINGHAPAVSPDDREFVLKVATLWERGGLAEDWIEQVLESLQLKREAGERVERPLGWIWQSLREKCRSAGLTFERLLATTAWPAELLAPPKTESVR